MITVVSWTIGALMRTLLSLLSTAVRLVMSMRIHPGGAIQTRVERQRVLVLVWALLVPVRMVFEATILSGVTSATTTIALDIRLATLLILGMIFGKTLAMILGVVVFVELSDHGLGFSVFGC